ncbi:MAG: 50S ribosomal protein L1 [Patescibacteria group bacterium]
MARGKKYQEIKKKIEKKEYSLEEAIDFIKKNKAAKFDESIEIHLNLRINPKKTEENIKGDVILPYGGFSQKKIAVFVEPEKEKEAKEAGADIIGGKELIEKIKETSNIDFDIAIATPKMMKELTSIAKILGPKGLMPSPKTGTLTENIKEAINEFKKGKIFFKNDEGGNLHLVVGKVSWEKEKIIANIKAFLEAVRKAKPSKVKGNFIKNFTICSTMGPALKIK